MKNKNSKTILLFICMSVFAVCAEASLYNDSAAMAGFTNKTSFDISMMGSVLKVDVEYAVYAPGNYPGLDISGHSEYVYAYQVFNKSQSNVAVDFFSVGILPGCSIDSVYTDTSYGTVGGAVPFAFHFPQSAGFVFISNALNPKQWSDVLLFTSIYSPTMGLGTVSGGGLGVMGSLPTPSIVPEPATILIIAPILYLLRNKKIRTK
ncbi:MAG: hypothetical protein ABSE89_04070 [Sedimentisphaerales bacterium]